MKSQLLILLALLGSFGLLVGQAVFAASEEQAREYAIELQGAENVSSVLIKALPGQLATVNNEKAISYKVTCEADGEAKTGNSFSVIPSATIGAEMVDLKWQIVSFVGTKSQQSANCTTEVPVTSIESGQRKLIIRRGQQMVIVAGKYKILVRRIN